MDFTLDNFDFKTDLLTSRAEIDELLEECDLQLKTYQARLVNRDLALGKAQNRTEDLTEDIAEVQAKIVSREAEFNSLPEGAKRREELAVELDMLRARLRKMNFRKSDTASPAAVVEKNADTGEAQLMLAYYTRFKSALETRKAQL